MQPHVHCSIIYNSQNMETTYVSINAGVPKPQATDGTAQQEVSGGQASEASSVFIAASHRSHYRLSSASCQISGGIRFS